MRRRNIICYGACGGLIFGLVIILLLDAIASLPRNALVSTVLREIHRPELWLAEVLAGWSGQQETAPILWLALLLFKWTAIGASASWLYAFTAGRPGKGMQ